ncbi:MAG: hypothetical protein K0S07_1510 [Chlamydiales bacterium]|jgi:flagellar basal-body rod modification protein FlgD|nr:hypothetical protein [Chlamydiales bacterium]
MAVEEIVSKNQVAKHAKGNNKILGKDDFLKMMLLQMRHQDPLNPMNNEQMLSQLAQFSALEQQSNLNDLMKESQTNQLCMDATRFLGKSVFVEDITAPPEEPKLLESRVQAISFTKDGPIMSLENGYSVTLAEIRQVSDQGSESVAR